MVAVVACHRKAMLGTKWVISLFVCPSKQIYGTVSSILTYPF